MLVGNVGSKGLPQLGHATSAFSPSTTGFASSGKSSFGRTVAATPFVRVGTKARIDTSEKTQPQGRRATNGTAPDISLRDSGQTKGARVRTFSVVEDEGEE